LRLEGYFRRRRGAALHSRHRPRTMQMMCPAVVFEAHPCARLAYKANSGLSDRSETACRVAAGTASFRSCVRPLTNEAMRTECPRTSWVV
jgi:hypothetical protein